MFTVCCDSCRELCFTQQYDYEECCCWDVMAYICSNIPKEPATSMFCVQESAGNYLPYDMESDPKRQYCHHAYMCCNDLPQCLIMHSFDVTAHLDWMLSCLAQLTSGPNWSSHPGDSVCQLWGKLISCLAELVTAFHCCKGADSQASFMGLSITRNAVLCMNHLLCDMQRSGCRKVWIDCL